jgi:hypothetical protein
LFNHPDPSKAAACAAASYLLSAGSLAKQKPLKVGFGERHFALLPVAKKMQFGA